MEGVATLLQGPLPQTHAERVAQLGRLLNHLQRTYGGQILAAGLYGSLARGEDADYSDIELFCVLDVPEYERDYEWVYGAGKAEINVLGIETARRAAREVDEFWAISQGRFVHAKLLMGDNALLEELRAQVRSITADEIRQALGRALVEELYEWLGKARNARAFTHVDANNKKTPGRLAALALKFTELCALLIGLANRRCYHTGMTMLEESLSLPDQPQGYAGLCRLVMTGELADSLQMVEAIEAAWSGMIHWCIDKGVEIRVADFPA